MTPPTISNELSETTPPPALPREPVAGRHANNFGFIRHLLAIVVVMQHACFNIDGDLRHEPLFRVFGSFGSGTVAVFGFFILSGFLITQSWASNPKLAAYFRNRILRIYPGFLVAALATIFVFGRLGADDPSYYRQLSLIQIAKCLVTLQIPGHLPAFGTLAAPGVLNGSFWTIPIEFICYVMVGAAGVTGLLRFRWLWPSLLALSLAVPEAVVMRCVPGGLPGWLSGLIPGFYSLLPAFLAGMCFYFYRQKIPFTWVGAVCAAALVVSTLWDLHTARIGLSLGGGYLLFMLAYAPLPLLRRANGRVDLSYGIYLYHWPCQMLLLIHTRWLSPWQLFAISLPCAAALAFASWCLVEGPALRLKAPQKKLSTPLETPGAA